MRLNAYLQALEKQKEEYASFEERADRADASVGYIITGISLMFAVYAIAEYITFGG